MATTDRLPTGHHNLDKGILMIQHPVVGAWRDVGEANEFQVTITTEDKPLVSSREGLSKEVDNAITKQEGSGSFKILDQNIHNAQLFGMAESFSKTTQVAATAKTAEVTAKLDLYVPINADYSEIDLENVVVKDEAETITYVENTDYKVDYELGMLMALSSGSISEDDILHITSYDIKDATFIDLYAGTDILIEILILFKGNPAKGRKKTLMTYASVTPNGDMQMISEDYANFGFNFKMLEKNKLPGNKAGLYWYRDRGVLT